VRASTRALTHGDQLAASWTPPLSSIFVARILGFTWALSNTHAFHSTACNRQQLSRFAGGKTACVHAWSDDAAAAKSVAVCK